MSEKLNLQQLQGKSLKEISAIKTAAETRKEELLALKAKGGKAWTTVLQSELDELAVSIVDLEELIETKQAEMKTEAGASNEEPKYTPAKGTEKMVHLKLVKGRRFNPITGVEESKEFVQMFTYSEWQLFKKHFENLGYTIMEVLHDPYGDAANYVVKK